jgi:hypothetical protein
MNLNGLPIRGTNNYKGIVTIGTDLTAGLGTTTLKAVGDGMGGYSPFQLSTTQVAIKASSFDLGMLDIYESQSTTIEYSGVRMRRADGVIRWQLISDNSGDFTIYSGANKSFSIPAAMQNVYAIGLDGLLNNTLRALTTGSTTSPLKLSTGVVQIDTGIFEVNTQMRFNNVIYNTVDDIVKFGGAIRIPTFASIGGTFTNSAHLHVRNAIASIAGRFEDNAGVRILEIGNGGYNIILGNNNDKLTSSSNSGYFDFNTNANGFDFNKQNPYSGSGTVGVIRAFYTINNHAGIVNGIFLNATEQSITGTTHNLIDLGTGGSTYVSRFKVSGAGNVTSTGGIGLFNYSGYFQFVCDGGALISAGTYESQTAWSINGSGTYLLRLRNSGTERLTINNVGTIAWGTTNEFPAIKKGTGATIDFVTADNVANSYCSINAGLITGYTNTSNTLRYKFGEISGGQGVSTREGEFTIGLIDAGQNSGLRFLPLSSGVSYIDGWSDGTSKAANYRVVMGSRSNNTALAITDSTTQENGTPFVFGFDVHDASAIVQINSTTRGFLPPRMTDAEVRAIPTPAEGLVVYNTTISHFCVYQGGNWVKINHSPM